MTIKVKYAEYDAHYAGRTVSVADYVASCIGRAPDYHAGALETVQAELSVAQELLGRLLGVLSETMTPEQISRVLGLEDPRYRGAHVVEED